jgi:hypothetical protein
MFKTGNYLVPKALLSQNLEKPESFRSLIRVLFTPVLPWIAMVDYGCPWIQKKPLSARLVKVVANKGF